MMKTILTSLFLLTFTASFSQSENDLSQIIELIVQDYKSDSVMVYHKFDNSLLQSDLERIKSDKELKVFEKYGTDLERVAPKIFDDTLTVEIEKIKVRFFPSQKLLDKKHKKRIKRFTTLNLQKNRKRPLAYVSIPLISTDGKKAIVYGSYVCDGLCGSGGVFHLEKVNGRWKIIKYEIKWVS